MSCPEFINMEHCFEIEKQLFKAFDNFELEDLSHMNEADNHYERSELTDASLNERAFETPPTLDAVVSVKIEYEELYKAIQGLPSVQRRRLVPTFICCRKEQLMEDRARESHDVPHTGRRV